MNRTNEVRVRLNDDELAVLDEMRTGVSRAAYLRSLIRKAPEIGDVADRTEALAILSRLARDGRTTAAIALERALRDGAGPVLDPRELLEGYDR